MKGAVYFIEAVGSGMVKIGFTHGMVSRRVRQMQTSNHCALEILAEFEGFDGEERSVHARFNHLRGLGEWFRLDEALKAFIDSVKATGLMI